MMPVDVPVRGEEPVQAAPLRAAAPGHASTRLVTVCADLALDPRFRLSEQERALLGGLLEGLIEDVADLLRFAHSEAPENDDATPSVSDLLASAGLDHDPALVALALRRTDEERLASIAGAQSSRIDALLLQSLISHDDGAVASAAMAVVLARGRRRNRLNRPVLLLDDLPPSLARRVANRVAAVLAVASAGGAATKWVEAVDVVCERHDEARGLAFLTGQLVEVLERSGRLDDALLTNAAVQGEMAIVAEAFARRSGLSFGRVADALVSGDSATFAAILRLSGCPRELTASVLAAAADLFGLEDPAQVMGMFDTLDEKALATARAWFVADCEFVMTVSKLGDRGDQHLG